MEISAASNTMPAQALVSQEQSQVAQAKATEQQASQEQATQVQASSEASGGGVDTYA